MKDKSAYGRMKNLPLNVAAANLLEEKALVGLRKVLGIGEALRDLLKEGRDAEAILAKKVEMVRGARQLTDELPERANNIANLIDAMLDLSNFVSAAKSDQKKKGRGSAKRRSKPLSR